MDELSGQGDLQGLFEARRRIVAAFEDIAAGTEALASLVVAQAEAPADPAEIARLRGALGEERAANAQLEERVRALRERSGGEAGAALAEAQNRMVALESADAAREAEIEAVLRELIPLLEEAC